MQPQWLRGIWLFSVLFQMRSVAAVEFIAALKVIFVTMLVGVVERAEASLMTSTFLIEIHVKKETRSKYFWGILLDNMVGWSKRSLLFWTFFWDKETMGLQRNLLYRAVRFAILGFFCSVNHLSGPLRWIWFRSVLFVLCFKVRCYKFSLLRLRFFLILINCHLQE